jgi:Notch-like protein
LLLFLTIGIFLLLFLADNTDGDPDGTTPTSLSTTYIIVAVAGILLLVIVVILVLSRKRVARGITWFPEGFFSSSNASKSPGPRSSKRRVPDGEEK